MFSTNRLHRYQANRQDRTFGEIDVLFEHRIPARKFKYTKADRESYTVKGEFALTRCRIRRFRAY